MMAIGCLAPSGCVHRTANPPLPQTDLADGYYFHTHVRPGNSPDTLFVLSFSGGGTRAAALSYGVLEELRRTTLRPDHPGSLLEEVDAISSVSGGSITAAAFALRGDALFTEFEPAFLKRNVQRLLLGRIINPFRWPKLWSKTYGRSDLAAELYDELLFQGATFSDLARQPGAYAVINATDISTGARFGFTQYHFDFLCADLGPIRVSQAVAASSAVPGLLSPVTLNNYAGQCDSPMAGVIRETLRSDNTAVDSRTRLHFVEMASYLDSTNHTYIHLVDGGVADNLGIRAVLDGIYAVETNPAAAEHFKGEGLERVAIVVVNAYSKPELGWPSREQPPGMLDLAIAGATIPMDRYSYETVELLKEQVERWRTRQRTLRDASPEAREIRFYPIIVSFADLPDAAERRYFLNQPTSLFLPDKDVSRLREVGGRLLRQSPVFQEFIADYDGRSPAG